MDREIVQNGALGEFGGESGAGFRGKLPLFVRQMRSHYAHFHEGLKHSRGGPF